MLISGKDLYGVNSIYFSLEQISNYFNAYKNKPKQFDQKTKDAILYRLNLISKKVNDITDGFKKKYPSISWVEMGMLHFISEMDIENYYIAEQTLFNETYNIQSFIKEFDNLYVLINHYLNSREFLNHTLSANEFESFISNNETLGGIYIYQLFYELKLRYNFMYNVSLKSFSINKLIDFWIETGKYKPNDSKKNLRRAKHSISEYFIAIISIASKEKNNLKILEYIQDLKTLVSGKKKINTKPIRISDAKEPQKVIFENDYPGIYTKNSVWTVKKK